MSALTSVVVSRQREGTGYVISFLGRSAAETFVYYISAAWVAKGWGDNVVP